MPACTESSSFSNTRSHAQQSGLFWIHSKELALQQLSASFSREGTATRSGPPAEGDRRCSLQGTTLQASGAPRNRCWATQTGHQIHGGSKTAKIRSVTPEKNQTSGVCGVSAQSLSRTPRYYTLRLLTARDRGEKMNHFYFRNRKQLNINANTWL